MKSIFVLSCIFVLTLTSCGNRENTGNGADDKPVEGPYQYQSDINQGADTSHTTTPGGANDSLGQHSNH